MSAGEVVSGLLAVGFLAWVVLAATGLGSWVRMAASFLAPASAERRELAWLEWKLEALKWVARRVGAAEARITEVERRRGESEGGGGGGVPGQAEGG